MNDNVIRVFVAGLAAVVSGAMLVVMISYVINACRGNLGNLLVRHVVEVTAGTLGIVATAGIGIYDQIPGVDVPWPTADQRLYLYLGSMLVLFIGFVEVGRHVLQRRQDTIRAAVDEARVRQAVSHVVDQLDARTLSGRTHAAIGILDDRYHLDTQRQATAVPADAAGRHRES